MILSTIKRHGGRSPLPLLGSTGNRNSGASVGSVVNAQIVMEAVASNRSSCTIATENVGAAARAAHRDGAGQQLALCPRDLTADHGLLRRRRARE